MLAVGLSGELVYPVDKGSGSITTLAGADGVIDIPAGVEYLEKGEKVEVELFRELQPPIWWWRARTRILLEKLAERLPWRLMLLNTGSLRARLYLEDGVADLACGLEPGCVPAGRNDGNKELQERAGPDLQGCRGIVGPCRPAHRGLAQGLGHEGRI